MGATPLLKLPTPELTETADGPDAFSDLALAVEAYVYSRILPTGVTHSPGHYWGSGTTYPLVSAGLKVGDSYLHTDNGLQWWNGSAWNGLIKATQLRLTGTGDASATSTAHPFQIGPDTGLNVAFDQNEIYARNNGADAVLGLGPQVGVPAPKANGQAEQHQDTGWQNLAIQAPASAFATASCNYRILNGVCYFSLAAKADNWSTNFRVTTFPGSALPDRTLYFTGMFAGYQGVQLTLSTAGQLTIASSFAGTNISLITHGAFPVS